MITDSAVLISHDAGGAEILSLWVRNNLNDFVACLDGPAISIFKKNLGEIPLVSFDDAMSANPPLITGTSWASDLEKKAMLYSKHNSKYCCTVLDHWVNYKERFLYNGITLQPDELWVFDDYAYTISSNLFLSIPKRLFENPYFAYVKVQLKPLVDSYSSPKMANRFQMHLRSEQSLLLALLLPLAS